MEIGGGGRRATSVVHGKWGRVQEIHKNMNESTLYTVMSANRDPSKIARINVHAEKGRENSIARGTNHTVSRENV